MISDIIFFGVGMEKIKVCVGGEEVGALFYKEVPFELV